ncbi:putative pectate lyase 2 [Glycine max]|uniref:putative pectate lyase 2 n=1 Tax=Glycine max TaxID=3847 RepID=UPI000719078C|nr:putative pectate lyase 2 [Glycine max]
MADCTIGFGKDATGGKYGAIYPVTDPSDDPANPKPGTLRYGAIQKEPFWIIFDKDMVKVEIADGPCITIQGVSHAIINGISIHDCKPAKPGLVRSTPDHVGHHLGSDGDACH